MNKKVLSIVLSWLMVAIVMFIIVNFSLESSEKSTATSEQIVNSVISGADTITNSQREMISLVTRKLAHFGIYMLLGFCLFNAFSFTLSKKFVYLELFSCLFAFLFSLFDEFVIQNIAFDRAPQITDVLIDFAGIIVGTAVYLALFIIVRKFNKKTEISS